MAKGFSVYLHDIAESIWTAQYNHPFVQGIGDGTVNLTAFKHWVRQDYLFLIEYSRLFAMATVRSMDLGSMTKFAQLAQTTLEVEMDLHRSYAQDFGISFHDLESEIKSPTCQGYTDFLLRTASVGTYPELVASLLPCMWSFNEIVLRLKDNGLPEQELCSRWILMYSDPEFGALAKWCRDLVDQIALGLPKKDLLQMEMAFLISSRYEYLFWEMAWNHEQWPF